MISIIIPTYNGKHLLYDCLESLRKQSYNDFECIIVDNGSNDETYQYIELNFPEIKLITLDKNYGVSYAVNRGIESANGEYIALLNNDTKVHENWLQELYNHIKTDDTIFSVGSKMLKLQDANIIDDAGEGYTILGWAYQIGAGKSQYKYNKSYEVFSNCGGAVLYSKKILDEIGYVDEEFFAYMEDVDIGYRARIYGYKNIYEPKAEVLHIGSATSGGKYNDFKAKLVGRNNIWVPYKNMPLIQLIFNIPFLLIGFTIKIIFFINKGFGKSYIEGIIEGITCHKKVSKVKYRKSHLKSYLEIECMLIISVFKFIIEKIKRI